MQRGAKAAAAGQSPSTYFRRTRPIWMVLIAAGMGFYAWVVFSPSTIPYDLLGPLGTLLEHLVKNHKTALNIGFLIAVLLHVGEAFYALKLSRTKGITDCTTRLRWFVQTLLFGIASLYYLLVYKPPKRQ